MHHRIFHRKSGRWDNIKNYKVVTYNSTYKVCNEPEFDYMHNLFDNLPFISPDIIFT